MCRKLKTVIVTLAILTIVGCNSGNDAKKHAVAKKLTVSGNVNPVTIYAATNVDNKYLVHAANVIAGYLDNNADGNWDNSQVAARLSNTGATLVIPKNESSQQAFINSLPASLKSLFQDDLKSQALYESEMVLCNAASFAACFPNAAAGRDASYEEILHLITHVGYAKEYPAKYGEDFAQASTVAIANDKARNDVARQLNNANKCTTTDGELKCTWNYTAPAWYTYTDETCDYGCMVTEYTYWTINAALGMLEHLSADVNYSNEYKCLQRSSFQAGNVCANDDGIKAIWGNTAAIVAGHLVPGANPDNFPTSIPYGPYSPNGTPVDWTIETVYK